MLAFQLCKKIFEPIGQVCSFSFFKWNPESHLGSTLTHSESPVTELFWSETQAPSPPYTNIRDYQLNPLRFLHPIHWIPVPILNFLCSTSFYSFFNCLDLLDKISKLTAKMCDHKDEWFVVFDDSYFCFSFFNIWISFLKFWHGYIAISKMDTCQKISDLEWAQIACLLEVSVEYVSKLFQNFTVLLSLRAFHKFHDIASVLSCSKMNRDFQSEHKIFTRTTYGECFCATVSAANWTRDLIQTESI